MGGKKKKKKTKKSKKIACPRCTKKIPRKSKYCPECGCDLALVRVEQDDEALIEELARLGTPEPSATAANRVRKVLEADQSSSDSRRPEEASSDAMDELQQAVQETSDALDFVAPQQPVTQQRPASPQQPVTQQQPVTPYPAPRPLQQQPVSRTGQQQRPSQPSQWPAPQTTMQPQQPVYHPMSVPVSQGQQAQYPVSSAYMSQPVQGSEYMPTANPPVSAQKTRHGNGLKITRTVFGILAIVFACALGIQVVSILIRYSFALSHSLSMGVFSLAWVMVAMAAGGIVALVKRRSKAGTIVAGLILMAGIFGLLFSGRYFGVLLSWIILSGGFGIVLLVSGAVQKGPHLDD